MLKANLVAEDLKTTGNVTSGYNDSHYNGYRTSSVTAKESENLLQQPSLYNSFKQNTKQSPVGIKQEEIESSYGLTSSIIKQIGNSPSQ